MVYGHDKLLLIGTIFCLVAITLFGCGSSEPEPDDGPCEDQQLVKWTDHKPMHNFAIGGSLIVSSDHPEYNISERTTYVDLDVVYFDSLIWQDNTFADPVTNSPIDEIMQSRKCLSAHYDRQHQIRQVIDDTNRVRSHFMWSFSPSFGGGYVDVAQSADRLASIVAKYGDGVNLKWDNENSQPEIFTEFLCQLRKSFNKKKLFSSKISVSGPFTSLWQKIPSTAKNSTSDGKLGSLLNSACKLPAPPVPVSRLQDSSPTADEPLTNDSSTTEEPTTEAPTTTTEEPTTEAPTMPPTIPPTTLATTTTTTGKSMPGLTIDYVDWIEAETFDLAAHEIFNTVNMTPSGNSDRFWLNQDELTRTAISLAQTFSNTSKIRLFFRTGLQEGQGMWEGPKTDLELMYAMRDGGYGGVSFWGVNAFPVAETEAPKQSPCCLDPDVTLDVTFRKCGDRGPGKPTICKSKSTYDSGACMWWQGGTPQNAEWLMTYFKNKVDYDDCPFNNSLYCKNNTIPPEKSSLLVV